MELIPKPNYNSLKRYWRRRRYQKLVGATAGSRKKYVKITRFKGSSGGFWKIKSVPKLRLKINIPSPLQLWCKFKDAYIQMMNNWASKFGGLNDDNVNFCGKRITNARRQGTAVVYSIDEVENRLLLEIYKALMATRS